MDRNESGFRPVQARCRLSFLSSCPPPTACRLPTPAGPDFSDMSAVCRPKRLGRHDYSDMSGLWATPRAERQERVRSAPRLGPISAFVPVHRHAPRRRTGPVSGRNNYSDMSAVYGRNPPQRRHNSDTSVLSTLQRTDRQERVRSAPRLGPDFGVRSCPSARHPSAYRPRRRARPDFSDMSAVCAPKRPGRHDYSDMSGLSTPGGAYRFLGCRPTARKPHGPKALTGVHPPFTQQGSSVIRGP